MADIDIRLYNRAAWDRQVTSGNKWTVPVTMDVIEAAREGRWEIKLTPLRSAPRSWFPPMAGSQVLCLASAGGQQGPILAAAGGIVTVFDNSPRQLAQDRRVATRDGLWIETVEGDMRDLSAFANDSFDLIVHPVSNCFVDQVRPVWAECYRVLRPHGLLLSGFANPVIYSFDPDRQNENVLQVRFPQPYSDLKSLTPEELRRYTDPGEPLVFGHTLEVLIGGQCDAGFAITGMFEDYGGPEHEVIDQYMPSYIATRAVKL